MSNLCHYFEKWSWFAYYWETDNIVETSWLCGALKVSSFDTRDADESSIKNFFFWIFDCKCLSLNVLLAKTNYSCMLLSVTSNYCRLQFGVFSLLLHLPVLWSFSLCYRQTTHAVRSTLKLTYIANILALCLKWSTFRSTPHFLVHLILLFWSGGWTPSELVFVQICTDSNAGYKLVVKLFVDSEFCLIWKTLHDSYVKSLLHIFDL